MPYAMSSVLACKNIHKYYHDGDRELRILTGVDLEVHEGEILAISGPSGVGKSTLLHIMGTLDKPSDGDIYYRGEALSAMGRKEVNRVRNEEIGFVFQFYHLLPEFTALENVMMPAISKGVSRAKALPRAEELLQTVGLTERMTHKPGQLSGGEQQRVAIARALYNKPGVILSDEPTGNLDEQTGGSIVELLWKLNEEQGLTLIIVTHDDTLAARAHRWIHVHDGQARVKK
jgi:lipoprotein-releasing system ATP-binding protein